MTAILVIWAVSAMPALLLFGMSLWLQHKRFGPLCSRKHTSIFWVIVMTIGIALSAIPVVGTIYFGIILRKEISLWKPELLK